MPHLDALRQLRSQLLQAPSLEEKCALLLAHERTEALRKRSPLFSQLLDGCSVEEKLVLGALAVLRPILGPHLEQGLDVDVTAPERWRMLLEQLTPVERFYREIGGVIGYQVELLERLREAPARAATYHAPTFDDISTPEPAQIRAGLEALPFVAEIYPLGGAADRLHLVEEHTGAELPAAKLQFAGRSLLAGLLRDLQAREWLYYRLFAVQLTTPVAIMTSWEKDNHRHVLEICEAHRWFGRPESSFRTFTQPLVPTVDERGQWHMVGPLKLLLKPGGHGALWKCARDAGVFEWLHASGRESVLVRQINNPIAGLDHGLLAFAGLGFSRQQAFGFASCPRRLQAAEGMNVLVETADGQIALTNVEYCDFAKCGIEDLPLRSGEPFSRFSSNTNILYANLAAIEQAVAKQPFPGLLVNLKSGAFVDERGERRVAPLARLESTMQNIADVLLEPKRAGEPLTPKRTFVTYNHRHKTISVAKKAYAPGGALQETPELCFHEMMGAARELLEACGVAAPPLCSALEYLERGPSFVFLYHPALGPLYSVIQQKLRGGSVGEGSELILELAELDAHNLSVQGSLCVRAERVLGATDGAGLLRYTHEVGRCRLHNVRIANRGVDWAKSASVWKMNVQRLESLEIELLGHSEFDAEDVCFEGAQKFVVEDGVRLVVRQERGVMKMWKKPIGAAPMWRYEWDNGVVLKRAGS